MHIPGMSVFVCICTFDYSYVQAKYATLSEQ